MQAGIQSSTEHRATITDVEDALAYDAADFRADFPRQNGFSYVLQLLVATIKSRSHPLRETPGNVLL